MVKRLFDLVVATAALVLAAPVLAVIAIAIRVDSEGPALHRSRRVGRNGQPFTLLKFRTMVLDAARLGPGITARHDPRVTRAGRFLRYTKLDELPQLVNVARGDMSLVGPRPEDPRYVEAYDDKARVILQWRPGLTSPATLSYRHEEALLASSSDPELTYKTEILPAKLALDVAYFERASFRTDLQVLVETARAIVTRTPPDLSALPLP